MEDGLVGFDLDGAAMGDRAGKEANRDMVFMFLNNFFSPNPAKPESKYAAVQHGWYQIRNAAVAGTALAVLAARGEKPVASIRWAACAPVSIRMASESAASSLFILPPSQSVRAARDAPPTG